MNEKHYIEEIQILVFYIMGTWFGVDMEQVSEILKPEQFWEHRLNIYRFEKLISFSNFNKENKEKIHYESPRIIRINRQNKPIGIFIEAPEDILTIRTSTIHAFPKLIPPPLNASVWGVALINDKIILMVDFYRLLMAGR